LGIDDSMPEELVLNSFAGIYLHGIFAASDPDQAQLLKPHRLVFRLIRSKGLLPNAND